VTFAVAGRSRGGGEFSYRSGAVTIAAEGAAPVAPAPAPVVTAPAQEPEPESEAVAAASTEAPAEEKGAWKKWALYGGLAFGNLLLVGLGFLAFRLIMGGGKSSVLEEADDDEEGAENATPSAAGKKGRVPSIDDLGLPSDAIDIDPAADKK
jgi:hypothetical protein